MSLWVTPDFVRPGCRDRDPFATWTVCRMRNVFVQTYLLSAPGCAGQAGAALSGQARWPCWDEVTDRLACDVVVPHHARHLVEVVHPRRHIKQRRPENGTGETLLQQVRAPFGPAFRPEHLLRAAHLLRTLPGSAARLKHRAQNLRVVLPRADGEVAHSAARVHVSATLLCSSARCANHEPLGRAAKGCTGAQSSSRPPCGRPPCCPGGRRSAPKRTRCPRRWRRSCSSGCRAPRRTARPSAGAP